MNYTGRPFRVPTGAKKERCDIENKIKLEQAKHRLEEAQARDRQKERKARTHRLIREGAALERVLPQIKSVELDELELYLQTKLRE